MKLYKDDLEFGLNKEIEIKTQIEKYFNESIKNTKEIYSNYCSYDFLGETTNNKYELKSRRNTKYKYDTTLLSLFKTTKAHNDFIFIFCFTDKICYIKYNKQLFETFNKKLIQIHRVDKYENSKIHYLIPVELLIDIN